MSQLDPRIEKIRAQYELARDDFWELPQKRGTWLVKHSALETVAAKAKITFDMPEIVEANSDAKTAVIVARGFMGDRSEWSFGEAAPNNNKNAYPFAMAEKRAKDRVILKLAGIHGLVYSEDEFAEPQKNDALPEHLEPTKDGTGTKVKKGWNASGERSSQGLKESGVWDEFQRELLECNTVTMLTKLALAWSTKAEADKWPASWKASAKQEINLRREHLLNGVPDDDTFPGDMPPNGNTYVNAYSGG